MFSARDRTEDTKWIGFEFLCASDAFNWVDRVCSLEFVSAERTGSCPLLINLPDRGNFPL